MKKNIAITNRFGGIHINIISIPCSIEHYVRWKWISLSKWDSSFGTFIIISSRFIQNNTMGRIIRTLTIYRGQGFSQTDFDQLKKTQGGLLSFNNFLSTSLNQEISLAFAESNQYNLDLVGVLFEITITPSISTSAFANVESASHFQEEEEVLFSMQSVFRTGQVKQIDKNRRLWQVDLTLTSDNDPQLHALTKCMQEETESSIGWHRLGQLMMKLGHFDKTEELYEMLLKQTTYEDEKAHLFHHLGLIKDGQENYAEAIEFYEKALEIDQKTLPANHPGLATS